MRDGRTISDFIKDIDDIAKKLKGLEEEMGDRYLSMGSNFCNVGNKTFEEIWALVKATPHLRRIIGSTEYYDLDVDGMTFISSFSGETKRVNRFTGEPEEGAF